MTHEVSIPEGASREEVYQAVVPQIRELVRTENDVIANLANTAAALKHALGFLWVGFYRNLGDQLLLGPFQGPVACTRIRLNEGVCGAAARERRTILVPDVNAFPGHIACSSASRSEIVIPLVIAGEVKLVLDIDSEKPDDFSELDKRYLEQVVGLLKDKYII